MTQPAPSTDRRPATRTVRAFTLIEMLVAVAVLVLIIGLLIVGLNRATKAAKDAAGRMNVASLKTATSQFISQFGFPPPMIKDWVPPTGAYIYTTVAGEKRLFVYQPSGLPAGIADRDTLRRDPPPTPPGGWGSSAGELADYYDIRYSNVSLPFYLAGACEEKGTADWQVPIDGVPGEGFLTPRQDGTFAVPNDLKSPTGKSRSTGNAFKSMIDTSKGGLRIVPSGELREFRDSDGRLYRYYVWIQGDRQGLTTTIDKLNIPRIILETMSRPEDRFKPLGTANAADQRTSLPELNAATWAILWPGPDGVFGDEPIDQLRLKLGVSDGVPELKVREMAISDNVAEVGQ